MSRKLLLGCLAVAASGLAIAFNLPRRAPVYALSVSSFVEHPLYDTPVRVEGELVPASLCRVPQACEYRFRMRERFPAVDAAAGTRGALQPELAVRFRSCLIADTFRSVPGVELSVVAEGELCFGCHQLEASQLFARCPAKYERPPRDLLTVPPIPDCAR